VSGEPSEVAWAYGRGRYADDDIHIPLDPRGATLNHFYALDAVETQSKHLWGVLDLTAITGNKDVEN
jgi:hypothetical protein